ncbi:MAG: hypothetical protein F6K42_32055, partial [Leptolyngbya sp. SIO1D8]|nr:hypothetical protein [Leptolyngbya sp. SIO1D8]
MKFSSLIDLAVLGGSTVLIPLAGIPAFANPIPESGSPTQVLQSGDEFTITGGVSS